MRPLAVLTLEVHALNALGWNWTQASATHGYNGVWTWQDNHSIQDIQNLPKHPLRISQTSVQAAVARASQTSRQCLKIATSLRLWGNLIVQYPPPCTVWFHINITRRQKTRTKQIGIRPVMQRSTFLLILHLAARFSTRKFVARSSTLRSCSAHSDTTISLSWSTQYPGAFSKLCRMQHCGIASLIDWKVEKDHLHITSHTKRAICDLQAVSGWPLSRQSTTPPPMVSSDTSLQPSLRTPALNTKSDKLSPANDWWRHWVKNDANVTHFPDDGLTPTRCYETFWRSLCFNWDFWGFHHKSTTSIQEQSWTRNEYPRGFEFMDVRPLSCGILWILWKELVYIYIVIYTIHYILYVYV